MDNSNTGKWIRAMIALETEPEPKEDEEVTEITIMPNTTCLQIAEMCERFSTAEFEVYCRIESVGGKPVATLIREPKL